MFVYLFAAYPAVRTTWFLYAYGSSFNVALSRTLLPCHPKYWFQEAALRTLTYNFSALGNLTVK